MGTTDTTPSDEAPSRQCGRCQQRFPADPEEHATALPGWWVCPSCREALFGSDG